MSYGLQNCDRRSAGPGASSVSGSLPALTMILALLLVLGGPTSATEAASDGDGGPRVVKLKAVGGLQFDRKRFTVTPGEKVRLVLSNVDTMMHNLVITEPDDRLTVVNAALQMGKEGPQKGYIPDSERVLHGIEVLGPQQEKSLTFTAPEKEAVYPYVCTFPGHGFIMYGAMYVTTDPDDLPPLAEDPNVPHQDAATATTGEGNRAPGNRVRVTRTFMPDSGPAAIAVGLPGGQNYCFDAGACYLRYAWRGGYIDDTVLLESKGDHFAKILGRVYYRRRGGFPIRIGSSPDRSAQRRDFLGYEIGEKAVTFRYRVAGVEVRERIEPRQEGSGLMRRFELGPTEGRPVWFLSDPEAGAEFSASAGEWNEGRLKLTADQAKQFTITMKERPKHAPLGYWSMNDELWKGSALPVKGVAGRALIFEGKNDEIATGIDMKDLAEGATLMAWARVPEDKDGGTVIGLNADGDARLAVEWDGGWSFGYIIGKNGQAGFGNVRIEELKPGWHHIALVLTDGGRSLYVDGRDPGEKPAGSENPSLSGELYIGSKGGEEHFQGRLDEVRIYDRALSRDEIRSVIERDKQHPARMHVVQEIGE